ncbi:MAG: femAB family protein [uncultured bacterium]|nr:MAG: femAB family protein [uncultured bacterium]
MKLQEWNKQVDHPLQAWEWGEFREQTGIVVVREAGMQITIHPIPHTPWKIGYYPKGSVPDNKQVENLRVVAQKYNCIMIKCEPKIEGTWKPMNGFVEGRPLFTKHNFVLDVTASEEELLAKMKQKTRYNIRIAEKKMVTIEIDNSEEAFEKYLELTEETTKRQGFYAHSREYHKKMWSVLRPAGIAHLLVAKLNGEILTTWVLFKFGDTLYYPYGASTREHREVMANNLVMWEAIKLAKKWKLKYLDMWGALEPDPDKNDPWYGFHNFKVGYGARHVEYVGTWDYVVRPGLYKVYQLVELVRWWWLRHKPSFAR